MTGIEVPIAYFIGGLLAIGGIQAVNTMSIRNNKQEVKELKEEKADKEDVTYLRDTVDDIKHVVYRIEGRLNGKS